MPTFTFTGFSPSELTLPEPDQIQLDPNYDSTSAYTFEITDDDATWSGDSTSDSTPDDTTQQTTIVRDENGTIVASGESYLEYTQTATDGYGASIDIFRVMIGTTTVGYVANGQIVPGNSYDFVETDITPSNEPAYTSIVDQTFDPDLANDMQGTDNDDTLYGGNGTDTLRGRDGADSIEGGADDDAIYGGAGADNIAGGGGSDDIYIEDGFGADTIDGGTGTQDDLKFRDLSTGITVTATGDKAGTATDGTDTLQYSEIEDIDGSDNDDVINLSMDSSGMEADGFQGDDSITGGSGNDDIDGDEGKDTINGGAGNDTLSGGDDADTFIIEDGFGTDTISGGEGVSSGADTDYDTIDLSATTGPVTVTYTGPEDGTITDGTDTITFSEVEHLILTDENDVVDASAVFDGVFGDNPGIDVDTGAGADSVEGSWGGDTIEGGTGNDSIIADYGDDTVFGGIGNDTAQGNDGNDELYGGTGDDLLDGGNEADSLFGGDGADILLGQSSDDDLSGGAGNDRLFGHSGQDTLTGDAGNDTLTGGSGDDTLTGGAADDTFAYSVGDGADTITDFNTGNSGALGDGDTTNNDFINLSGFYDNLAELREDFDDDSLLNQSNSTTEGGTVDYSDNDQMGAGDSLAFQGASQSSFSDDNTGVVCFTSGTAIRTPFGDFLIDDLRVGDLVDTMDNGPQPIAWIGKSEVQQRALAANPNLRPVLIPKGTFGAERNLLVSRQHALLMGPDHFARAIHLTKTTKGMRIANGKRQVTYIHLMFENHEVIFAENVPSESFYPGPMALEMFAPEMSRSFFSQFPEFQSACTNGLVALDFFGATARNVLSRRDILHLS